MFTNYFKADLFRAKKMKSPYILVAVLLALVLFSSLALLKFNLGAMGIDMEQFEEMTSNAANFDGLQDSFDINIDVNAGVEGENVEVPSLSKLLDKGMYYYDDIPTIFNAQIRESNAPLILAIFIALFVGDAYSLGLNKNIISGTKRRSQVVLSRFLVVALATFVVHVLLYLFTLLSAALMAESVKLAFSVDFFVYFLLSWMLSCTFGFLVAGIATITRSKVASVVTGVLLSMGFLTLILSIVDHLLVKNCGLPESMKISNYTIVQNTTMLSVGASSGDIIRVICVCVIYSALAVGISCLVSKKRDIA